MQAAWQKAGFFEGFFFWGGGIFGRIYGIIRGSLGESFFGEIYGGLFKFISTERVGFEVCIFAA